MDNKEHSTADLEARCRELEEALAFAEKNWQEASQANFLLDTKLKKATDELDKAIAERDAKIEVYREAYETVINSRTWKLSVKAKKLFGKKVS